MTIKRIHTMGFYNASGDSILVAKCGDRDSQQYDVAIAGEWTARITASLEHGITVLAGNLAIGDRADIMTAMFPNMND